MKTLLFRQAFIRHSIETGSTYSRFSGNPSPVEVSNLGLGAGVVHFSIFYLILTTNKTLSPLNWAKFKLVKLNLQLSISQDESTRTYEIYLNLKDFSCGFQS